MILLLCKYLNVSLMSSVGIRHGSLALHTHTNFFIEVGTVPSKFCKNHGNVVSTFQEPITWILLSNKSAEREISHQVVTRYVISLFFFEFGDNKIPGIRHVVTAGEN